MAINLGSAYGKVSLDASGVDKGVQSAKKSMLSLTDVGMKLGEGLSKAGTALTVGLTLPIVAFGVASVKAAMESESALANLRQTLISTGGAAGVTFDELTKDAAALQKVTKFSDETIVTGQAMLLTFTKIGKEVFPLATRAMLNMGEKFGSVEQASVQLGKALNDPIGGVTALRRVGVMLSDEQEKQIKHFMDMNDIASAQKVILKELEVEFGGLAEAAGKTPEGQWIIFLNKLDEVKEQVGRILLPVLIQFMTAVGKLLDMFLALPPGVQKTIVVFAGLLALLGPMLFIIGKLISFASSVAGFIELLGGAGITLGSVSAALGTLGTTISATLVPALGAIGAALLPILPEILLVVAVVGLLYLAWKKNLFGIQDATKSFIATTQRGWKIMTDGLQENTRNAGANIQATFAGMGTSIQTTFQRLGASASAGWNNFMSWLRNALSQARNYIATAFSNVNWGTVGKNILLGLANGMLLGLPNLLLMAKKIADGLLKQIKTALGIHSPSAEAMKLGVFTAQGFQMGLQKVSPEDMARSLAKPITGGSTSTQQTIIQNFASGLTMQQVRGMIAENNEALVNTMVGALSS